MHDTLLSKRLALPIFASDPLSSVAYATEAALVVLIGVSATAGHYVLPVAIAIAAVLAVVVISYMQTVRAYETSGGAYVVARENLGTMPSLVAAAGAAALTGVEPISNGVSAFRPPPGRNAARTLLAMAVIAITLFIGVSYLAVHMHATPSSSVSVVSEIARATFPTSSVMSPMY